ncbi:MAG: 1-acyl-sn-glycerol-3-phosphate acyltransferase [Clostridiales bacterium]|nr:1-acyl-sn-glycerol-3-phosphate acyltransferase [Clostridiales bacterium]
MKNALLWFVKITGILPFLAWYKPARYHEHERQKRNRSGEILIANHTTMMDFAMMLFVYPAQVIRVLMAEILYSNRFMTWFLTNLRGIRVNRYSPARTDKLSEAIETLNRGGLVGVFPEGRLNGNGKDFGPFLPFSSGAAYLALRTGAVVRPLYFHVAGGVFRRSHIMIGDAIDLQGLYGSDTEHTNVENASRYLRQKMEQLREETKFRAEYREHSLVTRFTKWSMRVGMRIAFPFRLHLAGKAENPLEMTRPCIVASNHISIYDPPLLCMIFPRLRLHILACEALYEYPMLGVLLRRLGCIRIDRNILDIEAFHIMQSSLEKNESIGIFPEGGLSGGEEMRDFKSGTILAAVSAGADIVPVYIAGQGKPFRKKGRDVWIGERIHIEGDMTPDNIRRGNELLKERIDELKQQANGGVEK